MEEVSTDEVRWEGGGEGRRDDLRREEMKREEVRR